MAPGGLDQNNHLTAHNTGVITTPMATGQSTVGSFAEVSHSNTIQEIREALIE